MSNKDNRKGILLAGGIGSRLNPITKVISKQLVPIYDKPMIYYPLTTLMLMGVEEILIITTPEFLALYKKLLGDGKHLGISIKYAIQEKPNGLPEAFIIGEEFIDDSPVVLILGDNLFHGNELLVNLKNASSSKQGGTIFAYSVRDPERYGVATFDSKNQVIDIKEKPLNSESNWAITGLYLYDQSVVQRSKNLKPSERGELEITDLNMSYLHDGLLNIEIMGRGMVWLDTGSFDSLHEASSYIRTLEHRQGLKVGCPEEVSWRLGLIDSQQLERNARNLINSGYGEYLMKLIEKNNI